MIHHEGRTAHDMYRDALGNVYWQGSKVQVRGMETVEVLNYVTEISEPWHHCHFVPGRRWNPWLALSEALWILAGRDDIAPLLPYNKNIKSFSDDGLTNYGAYGARIVDQIDPLIKRLEADPSDRRAILSIWEMRDLTAVTKDPPCNDMVMFKLREGKLHMTVINRSNDLHWGLYGVNIPTFGLLMEYIAARLGVQMGTQTHVSNSLHIYTGGPGMKDNWRITEKMAGAMGIASRPMPLHTRAFTASIKLDTLQAACNEVLDDGYHKGIEFLEFANDFLHWYRSGQRDPMTLWNIRHAGGFADWITAAEVWIEEGVDKFK